MPKKGDVRFLITADDSGLQRTAKRARASIDRIGKAAIGGAALAGAAALTGGILALNRTISESIKLANIQEKAEAKLGAVLMATGESAGFTLDQLKKMAAGMQGVTTVGDEVILAGQAILATFKEIKGEAFEGATQAALDMSTVMDQDLKSSMVQIGKALNDPIKGLSALTRVGVAFTEEQKELITTLQESGDIMGAQAVILKELESQFGGAAAALRDTFAGAVQAAGNAFGDLQEEIGFVITKNEFFLEGAKLLEETFIDLGGQIKENREFLSGLAKTMVVDVIGGISGVIKVMEFFHTGWIGIRIVGTAAINAIAIGLESLFEGLRAVLIPFDLLFDAAVKLGALDLNPFESVNIALDTFSDSSHDVLEDAVDDLLAVKKAYKETGKFIDDIQAKVKGLGVQYKETGDIAKRSFEETDKAIKDATGTTEDAVDWMDSLNASIAKLSGTSFSSFQTASQATQDLLHVTLEEIEATQDLGDEMAMMGVDMRDSFDNNIRGFIGKLFEGEFRTVKDAFNSLLGGMLSSFFDFISKIGTNTLIDAIFGAGASGGVTAGGLLGGGVQSAVTSSITSALGLPSLGDIGGKILGALGLGGAGTIGATSAAGVGATVAVEGVTFVAPAAATGAGGTSLSSLLGTIGAGGAIAGGIGLGVLSGIIDHFFSDKPTLSELFQEANVTPDLFDALGVKGSLVEINEIIQNTIPMAANFKDIAFDTDDAVVTMVDTINRFGIGAEETNATIESLSLRFDENTGKWVRFNDNLDGMFQTLQELNPATDEHLQLMAEQVTAQSGLSFASETLVQAYHDQIGTTEDAVDSQLALAVSAGIMSQSSSAAARAIIGSASNVEAAAGVLDSAFDFDHESGEITGIRNDIDGLLDTIEKAGETELTGKPIVDHESGEIIGYRKIDGQFHGGGTVPFDGTFFMKKGETVFPEGQNDLGGAIAKLTSEIVRLRKENRDIKASFSFNFDGLKKTVDKLITDKARTGNLNTLVHLT